MLKKQDLGINPYVANNGSRDQSLTGIGGLRVYVVNLNTCTVTKCNITFIFRQGQGQKYFIWFTGHWDGLNEYIYRKIDLMIE